MTLDLTTFDYAGAAQKLRDARDLIGEIVVTCSIVANFMPRVEAVTNPVIKRIYQGCVNTVAFLACNWRVRLPAMGWHIWPFKRPAPPPDGPLSS